MDIILVLIAENHLENKLMQRTITTFQLIEVLDLICITYIVQKAIVISIASKHKEGYLKGLELRYKEPYSTFVFGLKFEYKEINLTAIELKEKLKIVNKLIRDFETFETTNSIYARTVFNKIIGIYK
jgi:predicted transcriptional regulator with HTH domain